MKFTVIVAYTGECCEDSHIWAKIIDAPNPKEAAAKMRRAITRRGDFYQDLIVLPGAADVNNSVLYQKMEPV
jgi:hypothetical protein